VTVADSLISSVKLLAAPAGLKLKGVAGHWLVQHTAPVRIKASRAPAASHSEGADRPSYGTSHGHQNGGFNTSLHYLRWLEYESISFLTS